MIRRPVIRRPVIRRIATALLAIVLLAVLVPSLAAGGFLLWMRTQMPTTRGTVAVPGLDQPVEILRDTHAIPHIFAATERDGYFALGYVHAQDRLWQMETMRRAGAGRLAELFGTRFGDWALRLDRSMRTLGLYRQAESIYREMPPDVRAVFDAYAAGVNAYLATRTEALPIEFQLLGDTPEPWRPADSVVWSKMMALQLSSNVYEELFRARAMKRLSPDRLQDLFPGSPPGAPVTLSVQLNDGDIRHALEALPRLGFNTASNEWVLSGERTTTGKPILANDPHLGLEAPILWYLARIETPTLSLAGATVPGVPLHLLGHNAHVAWGFTTTGSDTQDLFVEKIDPKDPGRYLTPGGSEPFVTRRETIKVAGQPDETLTVRETRHGPVLTSPDVEGVAAEGQVLALAFTGLSARDTSAEALYRLNHAANATAVRKALSLYVAPQQNIVYADTDGTIGFLSPGLVPIRKAGDGRVPVPGWSGEYDWTGHIPFDELPRAVNPPSGQFVNANNAVVGPGYPHPLTADWAPAYRAERIVEMLGTRRHSPEEVAAEQMDTLSLAARRLLPLMLTLRPDTPMAADAVARLKLWDGRMARDRPEPLIFAWWLRELTRALFADELGPSFAPYWSQRADAVAHVLTDAPGWCDDVATPAKETCADALSSSLDAALSSVEQRHGGTLADWRWGEEHRAALNHRLFDRIPVLKNLFDLSIPADGGAFTVNRGDTRVRDPDQPFADVHGAGYRAVYDLADLGNSRFIIATGESGNPLSPHWGDLVRGWRDGGTLRLAGDRGTLAANGADLLTLTPRAPETTPR